MTPGGFIRGIRSGSGLDPDWPVPGVTKPDRLWQPCQTLDLTDHGKVGGLTLTLKTLAFILASGLYCGSSGGASVAVDSVLAECASNVYSILVEFTVLGTGTTQAPASAGVRGTNGWALLAPVGSGYYYFHGTGAFNSANPISPNTRHQMVIVSNGTGNALAIYLDGALIDSPANSAWVTATGNFLVGLESQGAVLSGIIHRVAFLNGTPWSSGDVTSIKNNLPAPLTDFAPHAMTAADTPSPYVISCSTYIGGYESFRAFDWGIGAGGWLANATTGWLQVDLGAGNTKQLYSYAVRSETSGNTSRSPKNWTMLGSNNGTDWDTLDTVTNQTAWSLNEIRSFICDTYTTAYRYFRLNITANNGDGGIVGTGELFLFA